MAITPSSTQKRPAFRRLTGTRFLTLLLLVCCGLPIATACTAMRFECDGHLLVARNHDWPFGEGMLVVNKRGIEKKGISAVKPASWVSKYGSVSFVQFGREIPFAGMNEEGLTVDILQLLDAQFPDADRRASVNAIQWLQYQLDTAKEVSEVIDSLRDIRPAPLMASFEKVHYFVTDASGDVAVIEFLDGKAVVHHGTAPTQCALANTCWDESVEHLGNASLGHAESSLCRFDRAVGAICDLPAGISNDERIDYAFESLDCVAQERLTQWSMVYEPKEHRISFQTAAAPQRRWIDLDDLQFDPETPVQILDVNSKHSGDLLTHLEPYSSGANQMLVDFSFNRLMPAGLPRMAVKQLVLSYPDSLRVAEPSHAVGAAK
jgi:penicillin V acylase-like amidase (Ntn superfamily)